ncbi:MAG: GMC family oxidoreductase [Gemmatimonadetes bacterium]|nr:GMC family oxidoreductase [Gemmatimonadota bacterium]
MPRVIESDICIIGSGISAAMVAEKLADERRASIVVVEAGDHTAPLEGRPETRRRFLAYGDNPWPNDHVDGHTADGIQSRSMLVGGMAMHWGGVTPRYSPEDFRLESLYGVGDDWPITYDDLEPFYVEAERRLGVAGEQGPPELDPRSAPFPQPPLPLSWNLQQLKQWISKAEIPFWSQPSAKNSLAYAGRPACCRNDTCAPICPIGAKYSPDFTWNALTASGRVQLVTRTLVRRLVPAQDSGRIEYATASSPDDPDTTVEFRARTFVVAAGYIWSPHLLLLSTSARYPNGLANASGLVGKYMTGHRSVQAFIRVPMRLYPGINAQHSLVSKQFMRPGRLDRYIRHDLRIWESAAGAEPRLRDDAGNLLLGDEILADWRTRAATGRARMRAYYDVLPDRESGITLDAQARNAWGDALPNLVFGDSEVSRSLRGWTEERLRQLFQDIVRACGGEILRVAASNFQDHPVGGCRMGDDPASSVVDSWGRAHEHENLFVVGAPTFVSGSCANGTLSFVAASLRSAAKIGEEYPAAS